MNRPKPRKIKLIEPFLLKKRRVIDSPEMVCLDSASGVSLDDTDLENISNRLEEMKKVSLPVLDFTPFLDLGSRNRYSALQEIFRQNNYVIACKDGRVADELKNIKLKDPENSIPFIVYDSDFEYKGSSSENISEVLKKNFLEFRRGYIEKKIFYWLESNITNPENKDWIELHNGSGSNMWLDIKGIIEQPNRAFFIAYQMGYLLTNGYIEDLDRVAGFVASNNNGWIIGSILARMFEKELFIIDKLGPSPRINISWMEDIAEDIHQRKVIIIEDLISTGREVDLLFLFLKYIGASIIAIVSLFDLERANPILISEDSVGSDFRIHSLCKPSKYLDNPGEELGYKRISKYEFNKRKDE